jgi:SAM-dependent methyltransferase
MIEVDWKKCRAINNISENIRLDELVGTHHEMKGRDLRILEIGSYQGHSTALLAQYGTVIAIDLWSDLHDGVKFKTRMGLINFDQFRVNMIELDLIDRVFPVMATSSFLDMLAPSAFDVIYVDAAHDYASVVKDIKKTERHLADDGLYLFHDYKRDGDPANLGVNIAVDELLATERFCVTYHYKGLVCLRKAANI